MNRIVCSGILLLSILLSVPCFGTKVIAWNKLPARSIYIDMDSPYNHERPFHSTVWINNHGPIASGQKVIGSHYLLHCFINIKIQEAGNPYIFRTNLSTPTSNSAWQCNDMGIIVYENGNDVVVSVHPLKGDDIDESSTLFTDKVAKTTFYKQ